MKRTERDRRDKANRDKRWPFRVKYWVTGDNVAEFKRDCRKAARNKAKQDLRNEREPLPRYPIERAYFD